MKRSVLVTALALSQVTLVQVSTGRRRISLVP